jgi:4-carboxymuconolactone decarboxylase
MNEREAGMRTRREVLGSEHVERTLGQAGRFAAPFQELLTGYAWGAVWSRPGLDRRTRSAITLMALVCLRAEDELALHVRAAVGNGLTVEEVREVLLQSAIYAGVPAANAAFAVAGDVLRREGLIE